MNSELTRVDIQTGLKYFTPANEHRRFVAYAPRPRGITSFKHQVEILREKDMDGSKDIQSDSTEPQKKSTKPDTFFKKYTLPMPPEPGTANEATFKKYVPLRTDSDEPIFKKYV